jgi:hypothetical protein
MAMYLAYFCSVAFICAFVQSTRATTTNIFCSTMAVLSTSSSSLPTPPKMRSALALVLAISRISFGPTSLFLPPSHGTSTPNSVRPEYTPQCSTSSGPRSNTGLLSPSSSRLP